MEQILKKKNVLNNLWLVLLLIGLAFTMVVIVFGVDPMIAGAHDTFHDFRHSIGMPCH